jgi:hypothetical protein
MLFGAIGMVIDFGRAYSAHSQMQSYIDQVALAAAAELDGRVSGTDNDGNPVVDAITRATDAANAVSKTSVFTDGGGNFQIAQLVFLTDAPTDANGEFDYSLVTGGTLTTTNPAHARYVLAIAQQASVRASLLDINIGGMGGGIDEIPIGTYAVATVKQVTCDSLSTLVMCNPFEGDASNSLESVFQSGEGYRMKLTAATSLGLTTTSNQIGLGVMKNPVDLSGTASGACEDTVTLPGYSGQTGAELEKLRDKCLLAVAETGLSCVNDSVLVKEALPESIVTGLDVRFDMFDQEMASLLTSDPNMADGQPRSSVFYPDIASVHGYILRSELTDFVAALNAEIDAGPGSLAIKNTRKTANNNRRDALLAAYPADASQPYSRQQHIPWAPQQHGPIESPVCFSSSCSGTGAPHGAIYASDIQPKDYAVAYYTPTVRTLSGTGTLDGTLLTGADDTFYRFYSNQERISATLQTYPASNGALWSGVAGNFVRTWPDNFMSVYPATDIDDIERRRVRVTVVNCGSKESVDVGDGQVSYRAEVVDVVDLFLTRPPKVTGCTTTYTSATDPEGIFPCANDLITSAELHVEYVGSVREELVESKSRTYAVLVH